MFDYTKTVVGLDVHKESIVAAVLPPDSDRVALTTKFENTPVALKTFVERLRSRGALTFIYEAGPCGYQVHRDLTAQGQECVVIAPGLIPTRPGDKVKTDRRDAEKLAQLHRAGQLTAVNVPTRADEADRDLVRAREDVMSERLRARHRLGKYLLRHGLVWRVTKSWGVKHREWLRALRFEFERYLSGSWIEQANSAIREVLDVPRHDRAVGHNGHGCDEGVQDRQYAIDESVRHGLPDPSTHSSLLFTDRRRIVLPGWH